jgi:hypothetical protein
LSVIREQWDGGEWQAHCRTLLSMRYKEHEIQWIPDRDRGDGGLEAYLFEGVGYQCYAPQDSYTTTAQLESQKAKIRIDLSTLTRNGTDTTKLLGTVLLKRWVLLTPEFDSRKLVEYARSKSKRIRETNPLPMWCASDFEIVVSTDDDFAFEKAQISSTAVPGISLRGLSRGVSNVYQAVDDGMALKLTEKLSVEPTLASDQDLLEAYRGELLECWIAGRSKMDELSAQFPTLHQAVTRRISVTRRSLVLTSTAVESQGRIVLDTAARQLAEALHSDVPSLGRSLCEELSWSQIAQWFMECPLRFRPVA